MTHEKKTTGVHKAPHVAPSPATEVKKAPEVEKPKKADIKEVATGLGNQINKLIAESPSMGPEDKGTLTAIAARLLAVGSPE